MAHKTMRPTSLSDSPTIFCLDKSGAFPIGPLPVMLFPQVASPPANVCFNLTSTELSLKIQLEAAHPPSPLHPRWTWYILIFVYPPPTTKMQVQQEKGLLSLMYTTSPPVPRIVSGIPQALSIYLLNEQTSVVPISANMCYLKIRFCTIFAIKKQQRWCEWALPSSTTTKQRKHVAFLKVFSFALKVFN